MENLNELMLETIGMNKKNAIKYIKKYSNQDMTDEYISNKYDCWRYKYVRSYNTKKKEDKPILKTYGNNVSRKVTKKINGKNRAVREYQYKDNWYSISELTELLDINFNTLSYNLKKGRSIEYILDRKPITEIYTYKGNKYTVKELAEIAGVTPNTIHKRLKYQGMTIAEAVEKGIDRVYPKKKFEYNGKYYTFEEFADMVGLSVDWVSRKLRKMTTYEFMQERENKNKQKC